MADDPTPAPAPAAPPAPTPAATPTFEEALGKREALDFAKDAWNNLVKLKDQNTDLKSKLPSKDQVIALATDIAELSAFRALGLPPLAITALSAKTAELEGAIALQARAALVSEVAKVAGVSADVLSTLASDLEFKIEEKVVGTKTTKVASVVTKDGDKVVHTPLLDWAKAKWAAFMPALMPTLAAPRPGSPTTLPYNPRPAITVDATPKTRRNQF